MSELYAQNLRVLRQRFPRLAQQVDAVDPSSIAVVPMGDGCCNAVVNGAALYAESPQMEAAAMLAERKAQPPKLLVCYGVGLGYHLERLFADYIQPHSCVIIVEPSLAMFRRAIETTSWEAILRHKGVRLWVGVDIATIHENAVQLFGEPSILFLTPILQAVVHRSSAAVQGEYFMRAADRIKNACGEIAGWYLCPAEDSYRGFMNFIRNLPESVGVPSFHHLESAFEGFVGIAVSTGPSLKHSFEWLRQVQNRAVIFCADSALKILLREGITPHAVGCLERVPETELLFDGVPSLPDTWLLSMPVLWPKTFSAYRGPRMHAMRNIGFSDWFFPEYVNYDCGNSVAHLNLTSLLRMGCRKVLLVGQDLAFDPYAEKTHADGIPAELASYGERQYKQLREETAAGRSAEGLYVDCHNGSQILTSSTLYQFRTTITRFIRIFGPQHTVYNVMPRDYGAVIDGAVHVDPADALGLLGEPCDVVGTIRARLAPHARGAADAKQREFLKERVDAMLGGLERVRQLILDLLDAVSAQRHQFNPIVHDESKYDALWNRLQVVANYLTDAATDDGEFFYQFIQALVQREMYMLSMKTEQLTLKQGSAAQRISDKLDYVFAWLNAVLIWTTRMQHFTRTWLRTDPFQQTARDTRTS